jgi:hypothetical protein
MVLYSNGQVPNSVVSVLLANGYDKKGRYYEQRLTPQTAARWRHAQAYCVAKWGKKPIIRPGGPNAYRPLEFQRYYYQDGVDAGNPKQAAYPGTSSHGGWWTDRRDGRRKDCLAIDVDEQGLTWGQVWEACRAAGFDCGLITKAIAGIDEDWHIIDFNAYGSMPAFAGATPIHPDLLEDDMANSDEILASVRETYNRQEQINVRDEQRHAETRNVASDALTAAQWSNRRQEEINARDEERHAQTRTMIAALTEAVKALSGGELTAESIQQITDAATATAREGAEAALAAAHQAEILTLQQAHDDEMSARDSTIADLQSQIASNENFEPAEPID